MAREGFTGESSGNGRAKNTLGLERVGELAYLRHRFGSLQNDIYDAAYAADERYTHTSATWLITPYNQFNWCLTRHAKGRPHPVTGDFI